MTDEEALDRLIEEVIEAGRGDRPEDAAEFIAGVQVGLIIASSHPADAARMRDVLRTSGSRPESSQTAALIGAKRLVLALRGVKPTERRLD